jgi:hypothetical protein
VEVQTTTPLAWIASQFAMDGRGYAASLLNQKKEPPQQFDQNLTILLTNSFLTYKLSVIAL